jgi:hypothetical protein
MAAAAPVFFGRRLEDVVWMAGSGSLLRVGARCRTRRRPLSRIGGRPRPCRAGRRRWGWLRPVERRSWWRTRSLPPRVGGSPASGLAMVVKGRAMGRRTVEREGSRQAGAMPNTQVAAPARRRQSQAPSTNWRGSAGRFLFTQLWMGRGWLAPQGWLESPQVWIGWIWVALTAASFPKVWPPSSDLRG